MKGEPRNDKQAADVYADLCRRRTFAEESARRPSVIEASMRRGFGASGVRAIFRELGLVELGEN